MSYIKPRLIEQKIAKLIIEKRKQKNLILESNLQEQSNIQIEKSIVPELKYIKIFKCILNFFKNINMLVLIIILICILLYFRYIEIHKRKQKIKEILEQDDSFSL